MAIMSLRVSVPEKGVVKTMQFEPSTLVYDSCKIIREKMPEANLGQAKDYGLFLSDEDSKKGVWMENGRTLEYYLVRTGDMLEYKKKIRTLRVRMLDGAVKTLMVDDSQAVGQLMVVICTRIGITNHEEYSLVREQSTEPPRTPSTPLLKREEEKERGKMGTLTLGRSKEKKMEQLRKQLHTDEELNWVDHSKTLREQGIDENENLLLRRKYFFSDQNIDARDPVQLNLLYVQCRDGILDGTHPVSQDEAFAFAGLQCQIQFGDYVETKHRSGFLDVREFLPVEYTKVKGAEKRIMQEYKKNNGIPEVDAKVKYTQRCRSLPTYGVTFFLVKEKIKGKNRLSPRLMGVNKECVMRIDEKTKQVLQIWSLEQVRRWAASPNTFTLDFGDYRENYFSVQTADGEKIAQLIAGYIDIILKKKKAKDHFGIDGDEGSTMLEDTVAPAKATLISHGTIKEGRAEESNIALPGVMRAGMNGELPYGSGSLQRAAQYGAIGGQILSTHLPPQGQQPKVYDTMSKSQRALVASIESAEHVIERADVDLQERVELPPLGDDMASKKWVEQEMETNKQQVESQLASMGAATAEVVQLTGVPERIDYVAVGAAVSTISSNLPDMTRGVKNISALIEEEERKTDLIGATRRLCGAFSDLMIAVNPQQPEQRHLVLAAAGRVGDASHAMIQTIEEPSDESKEFQDILVQLAKAVATSTAQLVLKAKTVSSMCEDQTLQDRVIHSATQCAFATSQLVACARVVAPTIDSPACQEQLTDAAKQVARAVEQLLKDAELSCPQDDRSLGDLRDAARQVTEALSSLLGHIRAGPRARATLQDQEVETIITTTEKMASYEGSSNEMVRQAKVLAEATTHLVTHIKGEAEVNEDDGDSQRLMGAARHLADATTRMIEAAKADEYHQQVDESADTLKDALSDLQGTLSQAVAESGVLSTTLEIIHKAITRTDETVSAEGISYVDLQTRMVRNCKEIARISQEMVSKSYTNTNELGQLALELSRHYSELADDTRYAVAVCYGSESAFRIRSSVQELGTACIELVKYAGSVRGNPSDTFAKRDLADSARIVSEKVAYVLAALQSSSRGTQACINAASTVSGIIGDLDTTIMFATAGTLNPEKEGDVFSDHREAILKTAKALVEDTKALVSGAASSQEQLAVAAQNAVRTIVNLSDVVKSGAASLTSQNSEAQVLVINAVKDVAAALANLIQATKNASGKSFNDPAMVYLKDAAKVMVTNVTSLLKTVKTVEDEHQRGTRALEAAIEAIAQEIRAYDADDQPTRQANPEELIRVTKPVTDATGKTVAAGQSLAQDDVIVAANMGRKVVADLLTICKAAASHAENSDAKYRALDAGRDVGIKVRELLQALHLVLQKPTQETRQLLIPASRNIAQAVTDLVAYAEILKGSDWIDPSDPTVIAENELLGAANSIEAAARKLAQLKPRSSAYKAADETLNFDEQIIEAAKSIATAVSALVKAASAAQRELVVQGRVDPNPRIASEDYQWSEGLISAARMVAAATHSLCEAANALVQGHATEEKLISAAKQVAASTAQLLVACQVKADMNSKAMHRLQAAGNAVKTATEHLVRAAKQAIEAEDERTLVISQRMVGGIAQVLDAQEEVLRKERELGEARVKLAAIRKAKYRDNPAGGPDSKDTSPEPASFASDF